MCIRDRRTADVLAQDPGAQVDHHPRAGSADGIDDGLGHIRVPAGQVAVAGFLVAQVHMHDAGAGVEGVARLGGHLLGGHRHRVLRRIREHAGERTGEDLSLIHI